MEFSERNVQELARMDKQIVINTYNLISNVVPELSVNQGVLTLSCGTQTLILTYFDECILNALCEFSFIPAWFLIDFIREHQVDDPLVKLKLMKNLGLIFIDQQPIGEFVRPTNFLFKILHLPKRPFETIPFNMLSHTIAKIDIYLRVCLGTCNELNQFLFDEFPNYADDISGNIHLDSGNISKEMKNSKYVHGLVERFAYRPNDQLNIFSNKSNDYLMLFEGERIPESEMASKNVMKIIDEKDIKIAKNPKKISQIENMIANQVQNGIVETEELKDHSMFFCAAETEDSYLLQFPDLIIPMKRNKNGIPNSIAIEMELTCKSLDSYETNLKKYKDSLKYGYVIWFCGSNRIERRIAEAFKNIGGTGDTISYIYPYVPPKRRELEI